MKAYDRYRWSLDEEEARAQELLREIEAEKAAEASRSAAGLSGDLEGYDAARDDGRYAPHLEQWLDEQEYGP